MTRVDGEQLHLVMVMVSWLMLMVIVSWLSYVQVR